MKRTRAGIGALGLAVWSLTASAQPAQEGSLAQAQSIASQVCAACHGADGNSPTPANPHLAAQHARYIAKQLDNFKSGARQNAIMAGMVTTLTPEDMKTLGVYYAQQKLRPAQAKDEALAREGEKIYRGGIASKAVPACAACHAPNGAGIPAQYPRLGGQHAEYTATQLKAFRSGERANDPEGMMQAIASRMTDREIQAVAEYIAGLR
ncbi:MAG: c-type cytochrome [Pseudomonadota bacterium]